MYAFDYSSIKYQIKSNHLFQVTRPIEKQKETETDRNTESQKHKQTEAQTKLSELQYTPLKCIGCGLPRRYALRRSMQIGEVCYI